MASNVAVASVFLAFTGVSSRQPHLFLLVHVRARERRACANVPIRGYVSVRISALSCPFFSGVVSEFLSSGVALHQSCLCVGGSPLSFCLVLLSVSLLPLVQCHHHHPFSLSCSIPMRTIGSLAEKLDMDPLLLMIPITMAASLSFSLPISTPPNAIAYATGLPPVWSL